MVCNFFVRLLVQKLEISKKRTKIVKNVPKLPKTYQYRHVLLKKRTRNMEDRFFFFFFLVVNFFCSSKISKAAPKFPKQLQAAPFAAPN